MKEIKGRDVVIGATKVSCPHDGWVAYDIQTPAVWVQYCSDSGQITIGRHDGEICNLAWYEMWCIKNLVAGDDAAAIEVFPQRDKLVDGQNHRHLWIIDPTALPAWGQQ